MSLWYAQDQDSGRVWIVGAENEQDAAERVKPQGVSVWQLRPLGAEFKGVITFNPEPWNPNTTQGDTDG